MISSFGSFIARLTENIAFLLSSAAIILAFAALANAQATSEHQVVNVDQPDIRRTDVVSYNFSSDDNELLDQVQRGCFNYLWNEVGDGGLLAKDRRTTEVASLAGVGFQLASLPIGVERGWITRDEGRRRAATILNTLVAASNNRRDGVFLHFVNAKDA
ncbi:MAG: hypothetical protein KDA61_18855, partial [Planctomycetales bacterium]|nr:hypothetical protein [Planctomycetales bacterium]